MTKEQLFEWAANEMDKIRDAINAQDEDIRPIFISSLINKGSDKMRHTSISQCSKLELLCAAIDNNCTISLLATGE